jgi:poly-beta-hydroxybutyrate-responsive repressor
MNTNSEKKLFSGSSKVPSDFLLPWLLLLLRNYSMHGYQITQTLGIFGLVTFDPATVYRTLRRLEKEGLISSGWQMGDSGPAKRVYSLTEGGEDYLRTWASAMEEYQRILDRFFELYTQQGVKNKRTDNKNDQQLSKLEKNPKVKS